MEEVRIDYGKILRKSLRYWYIMAFLLIISIGLAYFYLQTTQPQYRSGALLLIKDDEGSGQLNEASFFKDLGLGAGMRNLENEKAILYSTPLMQQVVEKLDLQYQYIQQAPLRKWELYQNSPIRVASWEPHELEEGDLYAQLEFEGKQGYRLAVESEEGLGEYEGKFGKSLALPSGRLTLTYVGGDIRYPIAVRITPSLSRAKELIAALSIEASSEESSILNIRLQDVSRHRAQDVLQALIEAYNQRDIDTENQVFKNTIALIEERIHLINDELSEVEQDVQDYKQRFNMTELSAEGSLLMNELEGYNKNLSSNDVQLSILESIEGFLEVNKDTFDFVPTNLSINNLTLTGQLNRFNELLAQQKRITADLGPKHQDRILIQEQIGAMRQTIIESIRSIKGDLLITRNATAGRRSELESRLRSLPRRERELIEIERKKTVKENLYLYLLEKREESAISMALIMQKGVIVEPPTLPIKPFSPKKNHVLTVAGFIGLVLPAGLILLILQLDDKIYTEEEIESATTVPIAGVLSLSGKKSQVVVRENSRSILTEMFRLLRTNLAYIVPGQQLRTLLITSSMSGEGKSFIALNLGITQALTGKKVVILELDLRKPKQDLYLNAEYSGPGVVNYLIDPDLESHQIIRKSDQHPNLFVISSGPKNPPNPGELILSLRLSNLVAELRETFDFVILDSPPVGLVADALQMKNLADATMYVVRSGETRKGQLQIVHDIAEKGKLPRPFIVLNGLRLKTRRRYGLASGYGYSYGYGYGYGYGDGYYYDADDHKKWRLFSLIKGKKKQKKHTDQHQHHAPDRQKSKKDSKPILQENGRN